MCARPAQGQWSACACLKDITAHYVKRSCPKQLLVTLERAATAAGHARVSGPRKHRLVEHLARYCMQPVLHFTRILCPAVTVDSAPRTVVVALVVLMIGGG